MKATLLINSLRMAFYLVAFDVYGGVAGAALERNYGPLSL